MAERRKSPKKVTEKTEINCRKAGKNAWAETGKPEKAVIFYGKPEKDTLLPTLLIECL